MGRGFRSQGISGVAAAAIIFSSASFSGAGPGDPDPTFDRDGLAIIDGWPERFDALALQRDGKILVSGPHAYTVARLLPGGGLDATFGQEGVVVTEISTTPWLDHPRSMAVQADGRIVVAGGAPWVISRDSWVDVGVARLNPNGSLDTTFGGDGRVATTLGGSWDEAWAVAVQSDGKILIAGETGNGNSATDALLIRYLPNGEPDPTFAGDGIAIVRIPGWSSTAYGLALQGNGRIVVAGAGGPAGGGRQGWVARVRPDGSLDSTFSGDGLFTSDGGWFDVAVQPDGKAVVSGEYLGDMAALRLTSAGSPDPSFGVSGVATMEFPLSAEARSVAIQRNGNVVAAGSMWTTGWYDLVVARFLPNGTPDPSFGSGGRIIRKSDTWYTGGDEVAVRSDGRVIVAGEFRYAGAVFRFLDCTIRGTAGADTITGTSGNDVICAGEGDDSIAGGGGTDILYGQGGADRIAGETGRDYLHGGGGLDSLLGGDSPDLLHGGDAADSLDGGQGLDVVDYSDSPAGVRIDLSVFPPIAADGDAAGDQLASIEGAVGSVYSDVLTGSGAANTFAGGSGPDRMDGRGGPDTLDFTASPYGVVLDLGSPQSVSGGDGDGDRIAGFESAIGSDFNDTMRGTTGRNTFDGLAANDDLYGREGDDRLVGGVGADSLDGGPGTDVCVKDISDSTYQCES